MAKHQSSSIPTTSAAKNKSPWLDCCRGDICRFLLLLALHLQAAPLQSEARVWCLCSKDVRPSGSYICALFKCIFVVTLLPLCAGGPHCTSHRAEDKVERRETDERRVSLSLSFFSRSLYRFTLHFNSCQRSILSRREFTIWHPGFWGSIKYIKKNTVSRITVAQDVMLHLLTYFT